MNNVHLFIHDIVNIDKKDSVVHSHRDIQTTKLTMTDSKGNEYQFDIFFAEKKVDQ